MWKLESKIIQYKRLFLLKEGEKHLQDRNNQNEILEPKHGGLLNLDDDSWDHWHQGGTQSIQFIMYERGLLFLRLKSPQVYPTTGKLHRGTRSLVIFPFILMRAGFSDLRPFIEGGRWFRLGYG